MGYLTRRAPGGNAQPDMARGRVNSIPDGSVTDPLRNPSGPEEYYSFVGDTGACFISCPRTVNASTPYPLIVFYRNDTMTPMTVTVSISQSDGSTEVLKENVIVPGLGSVSFNFIGNDAVQSGEDGGEERVKVNTSLGPRKDSFFRSIAVNPPPDRDPDIRGGNVGGPINPNQGEGRFPEPPSLGTIDARVRDSLWTKVEQEAQSSFSLFGLNKVSSRDNLNSEMNLILTDGRLDLSDIHEEVLRIHPGPLPRMFQKPDNSVIIYSFPTDKETGNQISFEDRSHPVTVVFEASGPTVLENAVGQLGDIYTLLMKDPQWTYKKLRY